MSVLSERLRQLAHELEQPVLFEGIDGAVSFADILKTLQLEDSGCSEAEILFRLREGKWRPEYRVWYGGQWRSAPSCRLLQQLILEPPECVSEVIGSLENTLGL